MWYRELAQTFPRVSGRLIGDPQDHPDSRWLKSLLLVCVCHTPSCHQDATLAKQSAAAGQDPEGGLLRVPLLDKRGYSGRPGGAGGIRGRAHVDGCVPGPLGVGEVACTETGEFATSCRKASGRKCV